MWIKIKEPEPYDDTHNSKWLGIFFWHIKQYLDQMDGSLVEAKVNIGVMFLTRNMMLCWRNHVE